MDASHRIKEFKDWNETLMDFTGAEELVCTVCERDTATAFHQVRLTADEIAMAMLHRNPDDSPTDFRERMDAATAAARKELGVDTPNRPSDAVTF